MTYSNYVNSTSATTGANNNTYTNYADKYKDGVGSTSPYGFTTVTDAIGTPFSYSNYNNWTRPAPTAYTMTATTAMFTQGAAISSTTLQPNAVAFTQDLNTMSNTKVKSDGKGMTYTATFTENIAANYAQGQPVKVSLITELINAVQTLWTNIKGSANTSLPTKAAGDPILPGDYKTAIEQATILAAAQPATAITGTPPNTTPAPGTARTTGYLNCAHWANTPGTNTYSAPYATAYTAPAGTDTYAAIGTEPATNR